MFVEQFRSAIEGAGTLAQINGLVPLLYRGFETGSISEAEAQTLESLIELRRGLVRERIVPVGIPAGRASLFPTKRLCASPDRRASRERQRRLAYTGPLPPRLADRYMPGQLAILRIVGDECRDKGVCGLHVEAIAARAGVSRRYVQKVIRLAALDGLITIQERPREGRKHDTNLIRIISAEWRQWLKRGSTRASRMPEPIGRTENRPTDTGVRSGDNSGGESKRRGFATGLPNDGRRYAPAGNGAPESKSRSAKRNRRNAAGGQRSLSAPPRS